MIGEKIFKWYYMYRPRQSKLNKVLRIKAIEFRLGLSIRLWCNMLPEIYRKIKGFPLYEISSYGNIRSWKKYRDLKRETPKILMPQKKSSGHKTIALSKNNKTKTLLIHRLVLGAFVGACPDKMECLHFDGNPKNNIVTNLRWGTRKENVMDSINHGTFARGSRQGNSKLIESDIPKIRELSKNGLGYIRISRKFGVKPNCIAKIIQGKSWLHV